jgi:hypothetical protein
MEQLQPEHTSGQWRLFIDLSEVSLKAVLVTPQWKEIPVCSTGSCSSHKRNVREPSGFAAKKYAMKNIGGLYVGQVG